MPTLCEFDTSEAAGTYLRTNALQSSPDTYRPLRGWEQSAGAVEFTISRVSPPPASTTSWRHGFDVFLVDVSKFHGEDVPAPTREALMSARELGEILFLENVAPERVALSAEGGLVISLRRGAERVAFECYNSGEIVFVISRGDGNPRVWEVAPDRGTLRAEIEAIFRQ